MIAGKANLDSSGLGNLNLTFSLQNCNSLNLTANITSYELKIAALKRLNTDIVFLSDARLISNKGVSGISRLKNSLRNSIGRKYNVLANLSSNSRGVAILSDTTLDLVSLHTYSDPEENFLFVKTIVNGTNLLLGSIYVNRLP